MSGRKKVYENWAYNAIIFIMLFTFFICYKQSFHIKTEEQEEAEYEAEKEETNLQLYKFSFSWGSLVKPENFLIMGLGKFQYDYLSSFTETDETKLANHKQ